MRESYRRLPMVVSRAWHASGGNRSAAGRLIAAGATKHGSVGERAAFLAPMVAGGVRDQRTPTSKLAQDEELLLGLGNICVV